MSSLPTAGNTAPAFALYDGQGRQHQFPAEPSTANQLVFFLKHDCATCSLVAPMVAQLQQTLLSSGLQVVGVSQSSRADTASFADSADLAFPIALDAELDVSDRYGFDAIPALVLIAGDGTVLSSFEGWDKSEWTQLVGRAAAAEGEGEGNIDLTPLATAVETLPDARPGCGSRAHDPDVSRRLDVIRGRATLAARRIRVPAEDDPFEFFASCGMTDGLPVVPPTEDRVLRMLEGTSHAATDIIADVPPNLVPVTVEKVAINAVMAGCRPEYLPVVLAAVEAACSGDFNLHGVLATTYFVGPVIVVNGPIRRAIGLNFQTNAFGQGTRANATIGRALQLIVRNIGGGRPGEVDMATLGQPGKYTCCIGEYEEVSAWDPLHVERGFDRHDSTVTVFAGEAPRAIRDQLSRGARSLATSIGWSLESVAHVKLRGIGEVMLVVSPEHARTFEREGVSKDDLRGYIQDATARPLRELLPDDRCEKGVAVNSLPRSWRDATGQPTREALDRPVPKFSRPDDILIVVAGGTAGKFSAVLGGWAPGASGSIAVTRKIHF